MSVPSIPRGPGLYEVTEPDGTRWITNLARRIGGRDTPPGQGLVNSATVLLGLLAAGLFAVSFAAQNQYIFHAKHQSWPAVIEAGALDAGMIIFSLLAIGLARGGQSARTERFLIVLCALGSAGMNYAAADVSSLRSVAAYVMPPVFLAVVTDRVIAVVRRHVLGREAGRSAWSAVGRAALAVLGAGGKAALYGLRLVLAPRSTCSGARTLVLLATPLPGTHHLAREHAQVDAARAALGTVRTAIDEDLRELRDRHELTAARAGDSLHAVQETVRTQNEAVREALRTQNEAVRETLRTEAPAALRAVLDPVRTAIDGDLRELRERHELAAAHLEETLSAAQQAFRTETGAVRETLRTEIEAVRDMLRTQTGPGDGQVPDVDRDALVDGLADQIRDAVRTGERWAPDYGQLMARTGYRRRWCEKAVQDARTQVLTEPGPHNRTGNPEPAVPEENS